MNLRTLFLVVAAAHIGVLAVVKVGSEAGVSVSTSASFASPEGFLVEITPSLSVGADEEKEGELESESPEESPYVEPIVPQSKRTSPTVEVSPFERRPTVLAKVAGERSRDAAPATKGKSSAGSGRTGGNKGVPGAAYSPVCIHRPAPAYPRTARLQKQTGVVRIRAWVRPDGAVDRVEIVRSSGHASLDLAAREAVQRWRFRPSLGAGKAVAVEVPVRFKLS